jgi:endonuclease YncB( thermonuclease family)
MSGPAPNYTHKAELVERVIDGDTYLLRLDLGTYAGVRLDPVVDIRLEGIDVVERSSALGPAAAALAEATLRRGKIVVQTSKPDLSGPLGVTFARTRGRVWVDGTDVADVLRSGGYEKP